MDQQKSERDKRAEPKAGGIQMQDVCCQMNIPFGTQTLRSMSGKGERSEVSAGQQAGCNQQPSRSRSLIRLAPQQQARREKTGQ